MSRLDSLCRLTARRDILNHQSAVALPHGAILEIGLGNGRTDSHLAEVFPTRRIVAFDRALAAHGSSVPAPGDLVLGEIAETGLAFVGQNAALAHADIGSGYAEVDAVTLTSLPGLMAGVLARGGIAVSGVPLDHRGLVALALPATVPTDRYFLYVGA